MDQILISLAIVMAVAVVAPLISAVVSRFLRIPIAVLEMSLGLLVGPGVLALVTDRTLIQSIATIGAWFLFYGAGYETDFSAMKGRLLTTATGSWLLCLALSIGAGVLVATLLLAPVAGTTPLVSGIFIGAAITSTGLGTILPMMRDADEIDTRVGRAVIASGIVGQFAPLIALAVLVGRFATPWALLFHLIYFAAIAGLCWIARKGLPRFAATAQTATLDAGGQFGIRMQLFICFAAVALGQLIGINVAIGAFCAGIIAQMLLGKTPTGERKVIDRKLKSIIYGAFLPIFFINAGLTFDLPGIIAQGAAAFALIPLFFIMKLILRGIVGSATLSRYTGLSSKTPLSKIPDGEAPTFRGRVVPAGVAWRERASTSLLVGTGLAAVIMIAQMGYESGALTSVTASALEGAGMMTALIFPTIALNLSRQARVLAASSAHPEHYKPL